MHVFGNPLWYTGINKDCHIFNACHSNAQPGTCDDFHWGCEEASLELRTRIEDLLAREETSALRKIVQEYADQVQVDGDFVTIRDCGGRVVGVVPMLTKTV